MKRLIIIPTYNERENITKMVERVMADDLRFDLLIVDDGSPDGTADLVREAQKRYPERLHMIEREGKLGLGTAYIAGFKYALEHGRHVLCETPMVLREAEAEELYAIAKERGLMLMEANKTAHCPAFNHLMVMIKSGLIGEVVDVEASLSKLWDDKPMLREFDVEQAGGSFYELGSYPLLPIIKLLGTDFKQLNFYSRMKNEVDMYTKGIMHYDKAVCTFKVGLGVKTEGSRDRQ